MKKKNIENSMIDLLKAEKLPVLILDTRWHAIFKPEEKPDIIRQLEEKLNGLLKEQGRLVNEIKELKRVKKKLMDEVVAQMGSMSEKQSKSSQKLILETTERITVDSDNLMDMPYKIKEANQQLLVAGIRICYERMRGRRESLEELDQEINSMREVLKSKVAYKVSLEEEQDKVYSLLHDLLGPKVIELFDNK